MHAGEIDAPARSSAPSKNPVATHPPRGFGFWVGYLGLVMAVLLLTMEGAVRMLRLAPQIPSPRKTIFARDPHMPFRLRPSAKVTGRSDSGEFTIRYEHNRLGFRGPEMSRQKAPDVFRIFALGDSFTYGIGVDYEDTVTRQLEVLFNAREGHHPRVEVINGGVPRFYPEAERLLLDHYALALAPNLVLVMFAPNDVVDTYYGNDAIALAEGGYLLTKEGARMINALPEPLRWLHGHSHLTRWLLTRIVKARARAVDRHPPWSAVYVENGAFEPTWREVERQYVAMIALARAHNTLIAFAHVPQRDPLDGTAAYPGIRLARFCDQQAVPFIDLLEGMRGAQRERVIYWPLDGHPNAEGTRVMARELFAGLREIVP